MTSARWGVLNLPSESIGDPMSLHVKGFYRTKVWDTIR